MGFLEWLEATSLAEWVRSSYVGYPTMITFHAIGMAIMVGVALVFALRLLGMFSGIPLPDIRRFLGVAWIGFVINMLSGSALFTTQSVAYVQDGTFLTKMALVFAGMILIAILQGMGTRDAASWAAGNVAVNVRLIAFASIVCWVGATVTGRLVAYLQ